MITSGTFLFLRTLPRMFPRMCGRSKQLECDDYTFQFENDYIFVFANKVSEKTTIELDNALEENYMTVYVKTINGKTISINCHKNRKQLLYRMKLREDHRSPRGMTYLVHHGKVMNEKKTIEENNMEQKLRLKCRGMEKSELMDTLESEEDREKKVG